ncbi:hypothetical protein PIB30_056069 [Stylosanthes scabra]|uniref:Uncharacterized protein n=1 Tax=Stylosanthes scabra TaxID=79078 RepID=A0ABU6QJY4_9FABA|nr:hypothetical protein [Stylosanthes scabra]
MVQETFEILMDQVRHLNPAIDYSMITLDTRWDPKAKRSYNPKAEAESQPEPAEQPGPVEQPGPRADEQRAEEVADGEGGVGYVPSSRNLASFYGAELVGVFSEYLNYQRLCQLLFLFHLGFLPGHNLILDGRISQTLDLGKYTESYQVIYHNEVEYRSHEN